MPPLFVCVECILPFCLSHKSQKFLSRAIRAFSNCVSKTISLSSSGGVSLGGFCWIKDIIRGRSEFFTSSSRCSKCLRLFFNLEICSSTWLGLGPTKITIPSNRRLVLKYMCSSILAAMLPLFNSSASAAHAKCDWDFPSGRLVHSDHQTCEYSPLVEEDIPSETPGGTAFSVRTPSTFHLAACNIPPIWLAVLGQSPPVAEMITAFVPANCVNRVVARDDSIKRGCICCSSARLFEWSSSIRSESTALFDSTIAARSIAAPACFIASPASFLACPASAFNREFTPSAICMAFMFPRNSVAKATTRIIQNTAPITSKILFFRSYSFARNNLMKISTPSPATPTQTKTNPQSPTDSQNLSDVKSREVIHKFYSRQQRLAVWTLISLAMYAALLLTNILTKKNGQGSPHP
jgi:hypothetical protein